MFNWHEEARQQWNERAGHWNKGSREMWDSGSRSTVIPFLQRYAAKGAAVLDVGCGDGYGAYKAGQAGYVVCGVDLSENMIEMAKQHEEKGRLTFLQADLAALPFSDEAFDAVMAVNSLEWTAQPLQALEEMRRVLKSGGHACVAILGPTAMPRTNSYRRLYNEPVICNTMMPWEFAKLAAENGFTIIDGQGVYKREVREQHVAGLPAELRQAVSFLWVFMLQKS
ncbi:class I SAM-dependent methyltransferase [Ectobacillus ponti]|uniref:Class I SAM-dependent methyltransferase n=1 Tax=Ectobacillus ponti TaxID=2961894 RepID=A0AA41X9N9_9BACI|nr:class I SAM-dependent methyltransferase [Ectobacillus ponti]MCP8968925.1 class I SAM-dependent methyltransferase [Ectobacillus ponti]